MQEEGVTQENSKTPKFQDKKRNVKFPMDKPKVVKMKHKDANQEEVIANKGYVAHLFPTKANQAKEQFF